MKRRDLIKLIASAALTTKLASPSFATLFNEDKAISKDQPAVSITMDDPQSEATPKYSAEERNAQILSAFAKHGDLKAALFVCGMRVDNEPGRNLLNAWNKAGHTIANHSYSHLYFPSKKIDLARFTDDLLKGEAVIKNYAQFKKLFRFPFLKEGDSLEKRDGMRAFLKEHNYHTGHVSIDASDWYVDERLRKRLTESPNADIKPYRDYYLNHIWDRATFYNNLAVKMLNRSIKHTLLIHHNLLNALFLGDLLDMFKSKGWQLINADEAFQDAIYNEAPKILPAGESIIWALAKETNKFESILRYPGEDSEYEEDGMNKLHL